MAYKKRAAKAFSMARDWLLEHSYLATLAAAVAMIVASAMYTEHVRLEKERALSAAAQAAEIKATSLPEIAATPLPTIAPLTLMQTAYKPRIVTVKPASGEIVRA